MTVPAVTRQPTSKRSSMRKMGSFPWGRRSKYLVLAFWIIVVALTGPLAARLQGAEKNNLSAYLPARSPARR